ncbi:MAG TPA: CBS domain-containing protein [Methanoregula sp.]|nr:CBS domain-containing protein [Methanoregula sp.]
MSKDIVSVSDDQTVATVAGIMGEERVGSVIVDGKGKPSGIFTVRETSSQNSLLRANPLMSRSVTHPHLR